MKIKFISIFCVASLFMGFQSQSSFAQCDTAAITGDLTVCANELAVLQGTPSDVWNEVAGLNSQTYASVGFTIGNKGYVNMTNGEFWEYDQTTDTWAQKASFFDTRIYAVGFTIGNKGYFGTGFSYDPVNGDYPQTNDFWEFDPTANTWTQKANYPGGIRASAFGFSIGTKGYVGGGFTDPSNGQGINTVSYDDFWEYDPLNNSWLQKANYPVATDGATSFSINNKGYVVAGFGSSDVNEYDPINNTWTNVTYYYGGAISGLSSFVIGNVAYVGLGYSSGGFLVYESFDMFDPTTYTWTPVANFAGGRRAYAASFAIGNRGYICGGRIDNSTATTNTVFEYTPEANYSWSTGATTQSITVANAGTYTLNMTFPITGCSASSATATVVHNAIPTLSVTGTDSICWGGNTTLTASGNGLNYAWSTGDSVATVTLYPTNDTTYYVTSTNANNCSTIDTVNVIVNALPSVTFTGNDTICSGSSTILTASGGTSFLWSTGDTTAAITVSPTTFNEYSVLVTDANGCSTDDTILVWVNVCSGINELGANQNISLYPNPASNLVKVSAKGALLETIKIYNLAGALVYEQVASKSEEVLNINIPAGIYYMHLKTDAGTSIKKFVVQ